MRGQAHVSTHRFGSTLCCAKRYLEESSPIQRIPYFCERRLRFPRADLGHVQQSIKPRIEVVVVHDTLSLVR